MGSTAAVAATGGLNLLAKEAKKAVAPDIRIPSAPEPPKTTTSREADQAARDAQRRQRQQASASRGRAGTILTGQLGVTQPAPVANKTLLGA